MMNSLLNSFKEVGYLPNGNSITETSLEVPFQNFTCFVTIVNNQYKVFVYDTDNNVIDESKWYKRSIYVAKYVKKYAMNF